MHKIFWIGARESDIGNEELFYGSITRYGTDSNNNIAFCNNRSTSSYDDFLMTSLSNVLEKVNDCKFIFANSLMAYKFGEQVYNHTLCLNDLAVLEALNDKIFFRQLISDIVKVPPSIVINNYSGIDYNFISSIFGYKYTSYVIQSAKGSGGAGSFLFTSNQNVENVSTLSQPMIITPYFKETMPINIHIAISKEEFRIFPPSIQLISNLFNYTGSDFVKYKTLNKNVKERIIFQCASVAKKLQILGARGVFGIDVLLQNNEIYFIECNFRYQGSTFLLNMGLQKYDMPSIFKIHYQSFYQSAIQIPFDIYNLDINYSSFRRTQNNTDTVLPAPIKIKKDGNKTAPLRDGYLQYEVFNESIFDFVK